VPTDAYSLEEAVRDGFLVPPRAVSMPLKFQREGSSTTSYLKKTRTSGTRSNGTKKAACPTGWKPRRSTSG